MSSNEVKSFSVTKESLVSGGKRKTRKAGRKGQEGGNAPVISISDNGAVRGVSSDGMNVRGVSSDGMNVRAFSPDSVASTASSTKVDTWLRIPNSSPQIAPQPSYVPQQLQKQISGGNNSDKHIKVELKKGGVAHKKVHLNPKKHAQAPISMPKKDKYRKTRKVTLGLVSMKRRVTRAKKMRDKVKDMPLDELKAQLIKKGLIKPSSKAPESVLRQIALDAQIVAGKAL
jgi:hypothetical protein